MRFKGGFNQLGQVLPKKGADFLGRNLENNQNINEETNEFSARAAKSASAYADHMNNMNEVTVKLSPTFLLFPKE